MTWRVLAGFAALLCTLSSAALAQGSAQSINLPIVSPGDRLGWNAVQDDYRFSVKTAQTVRLELSSPKLDLSQYRDRSRRDAYMGYERYDNAPFATNLRIQYSSGAALLQKTYRISAKNTWALVWNAELAAGQYPLHLTSSGNGKNALAFSISGARLLASQFTLNASGRASALQLAARLEVTQAQLGQRIRIGNYDADGPAKLRLNLILPSGECVALTSSRDLAWASDALTVTKARVGTWLIVSQIGAHPKQLSNAFTLKLETQRAAGQPFERLYAQLPTVAPALTTPSELNISLLPAETLPTAPVKPVSTSAVSSNPASSNPVLPASSQPTSGTTRPLIAVSTSRVPAPAALIWTVPTPSSQAPTTITRPVPQPSADQPTVTPPPSNPSAALEPTPAVPLIAVPTPPVAPPSPTLPHPSSLHPSSASADLSVQLEVSPNPAAPSEDITVTAIARNDGPDTADDTKLSLALPAGLTWRSNSVSQGQCQRVADTLECALGPLERGESAVLLLVVQSRVTAELNFAARVGGAQPDPDLSNNSAEFPVLVSVPPTPAQLEITREVVQPSPALPSETVRVRLWISNSGGTETAFTLTDDPTELLQPLLEPRWEGSLSAGERREIVYDARVRSGEPALGQLRATLSAPDLEPITADTPFSRVNATLTVRYVGAAAPRPNADAPFQISLQNPLTRAVTLTLETDATGLTTDLEPRLELKLTPGEERVLNVMTRAEVGGEYALAGALTLNDQSVAAPARAPVTVTELPSAQRRSQLQLSVTLQGAPAGASLILSDLIPNGSTYVAGSSRLTILGPAPAASPVPTANTAPSSAVNCPCPPVEIALPDPLELDGRLFWVLPVTVTDASHTYRLGYAVEHSAALEVAGAQDIGALLQLPGVSGRPALYRVLQGSPTLIDAYTRAVQSSSDSAPAQRLRIGALIVRPLTGTLLRDRDQTNVLVDLPLKASDIVLSVGGVAVPATQLGQRTFDEGTGRLTLEFIAVKFQPGRNTLTLTATDASGEVLRDTVEVLVAGAATRFEISNATPLTTDPQDRPALRITLLDANDLPAQDGFVTIQTNPEPSVRDADPNTPGFQLRTVGGSVIVPLSAIAGRTVVTATVRIGALSASAAFPVISSDRPWIVIGNLGAGVAFSSNLALSLDAQGFARGSLGDGYLLTVAVNLRASLGDVKVIGGSLSPNSNPFERYPLLGDSSTQGTDATSSDPFYIRLERGASFAQYGSFTPEFGGRLSAYNAANQGLLGLWRSDGLRIAAFASWQVQTTLSNSSPGQPYGARGDGTSLYRLASASIQAGSEQVRIVTRSSSNPDLVVSDRGLTRLTDYAIDNQAGTIFLTKALATTDDNGNPQYLVVDYASVSDNRSIAWRFGARAGLELGLWRISVTALQLEVKPALLSAGLSYAQNGLRLESELAYAGDWGAWLSGGYRADGLELSADYQNLGLGYVGVNAGTGSDLRVSGAYAASEALKFSLSSTWSRSYASPADTIGVTALASNDFGGFTALAGLRFNSAISPVSSTTSAYGVVGVTVPLGAVRLSSELRVPLIANAPFQIAGALEWALFENLKLEIREVYGFDGSNSGSIGLRGNLGNTNLSASYDLPASSGDAGLARAGFDTTVPLGAGFSYTLGAAISSSSAQPLEVSASMGVLVARDEMRGSAVAQFSYGSGGFKQVYRIAGIWQPETRLTLSPSVELTFGPQGDGLKFSVAGAYRGSDLSVLTQHSGRSGLYAPTGPDFSGELQSAYSITPDLELRGGAAYRVSSDALTLQFNIATRYWLTDAFAIGGQAIWQGQPSFSSRLAVGIEGTARLWSGLALTGGVNLIGFEAPIGSSLTQPGFYIRFDWVFDERSFGLR